ncbi:hypothetical protein GCM10012286_35050 [Streptomyces lasiicapitis]|uniref:Uncharacterized protein n=1 Tax=Streptomyces lasiicapitis TaxID=1923961 RepID=A0ABQ2M1I6_9ACTN|nr:hypothetical protein GCM10012286_35050 [Streptomyces lasiicapitis]
MREMQKRAASICPACKQPVASQIKRHKTLGVFVPLWGPGPCRNPDCAEYEPAHHRPPTRT